MLVTYHYEDGSWWAESADLLSFSAVASDLHELRRRVREGLEFYTGGPVDMLEQNDDGSPVRKVTFTRPIWEPALGHSPGEQVSPSTSSRPGSLTMYRTPRRETITGHPEPSKP